MGADLAAVCKEAGLLSFKRWLEGREVTAASDDSAEEESLEKRLLVTREDIKVAFSKVGPSAMREVAIDVPKVSRTQFTIGWSPFFGIPFLFHFICLRMFLLMMMILRRGCQSYIL